MYYRQPRYFGEFHCIGGDCPDNCCYGWNIFWDKKEIDKVKNAKKLSPELRELIEKSFILRGDKNDKFRVDLDDHWKCPCVTEDGLCRIQKELGAEYLSLVCTEYPRCNIYTENTFYRFDRMSCPVIIDQLLNNEKCMELISLSAEKDNGKRVYILNSDDDTAKNPELKCRSGIFEFFYELISDKKIDVENAAVLGALAAESLTQTVAREDYDSIPEEIKTLRKQLRSSSVLNKVKAIKPNDQLKIGFLPGIIEQVIGNAATVILRDEKGVPSLDLYKRGEERLRETLKGREFFLRNIALNMLLELDAPFTFSYKKIFENYSLFVAALGCVKLNLTAVSVTDKPISIRTWGQEFHYEGDDNKLIGMTALISRGVCQNKLKSEEIIDILNKYEMTKPALLALLVK